MAASFENIAESMATSIKEQPDSTSIEAMDREPPVADDGDSTGFNPSQEDDAVRFSSMEDCDGAQEEKTTRHYANVGHVDSGLGETELNASSDGQSGKSDELTVTSSVPASGERGETASSVEDSGMDAQEPSPSEDVEEEADDKDDDGKDDDDDGNGEDGGQEGDLDLYHYTKREEFTSEIFKVEISNLPKKFGFKDFRRRLNNKLNLKPHKIKFLPYNKAFVTFKSEAECEKALAVIPGHVWKGQAVSAKRAKPSADPQMKRKAETDGDKPSKKMKVESKEDDLPPEIRLKNAVTPLWNMPYEDQLKKKTATVEEVLKSLTKMREVKDVLAEQRKKFNGLCCELLPIKANPDNTEGYRNKCEFTISKSAEGKDNTVGFRYGLYKEGCNVGSALDIAFLPEAMKKVLQAFQQYLDSSPYRSYDPVTHEGYWRQLTVRTTLRGGVMAIPMIQQYDLTEEQVAAEKEGLVKFFSEGPGQDCGVTSLCFSCLNSRNATRPSPDVGPEGSECEHLWGDKHIFESLLGLTFRISPAAFFQVNTPMAEVLYSQVADWLELTENTVVLDICCGTGTIGLSMAKRVKKVIGIELCKEAIEDAKANAELNGITNVEYHCDRAENVVVEVMKGLRATHVVAVVDPPRAGLHKVVVKALRNCRELKTLIYVACNANSAKGNFVDLMRPSSNKLKGEPYQPVKAVPMDLFPHTPHCELVMLLERGKRASSPQSQD